MKARLISLAFAVTIPFRIVAAVLNIALSPAIDVLARPFATPFWMHGIYKPFKDWDKTNG